jgi:hypothetical protein
MQTHAIPFPRGAEMTRLYDPDSDVEIVIVFRQPQRPRMPGLHRFVDRFVKNAPRHVEVVHFPKRRLR